MADIITVQHLVKQYKSAQQKAVDDISFSVEDGEFFTLLGPNGAGKTTTISILNTTLAKTSGTLRVAGFDVDTEPSKVRTSIGVIFQNPSLDANLTAEENIRFHAVLYHVFPYRPTFELMPIAYKKKVMELAEILGIHRDIHKPIKTFSGGMKRKLEIIRGLIHNPKVLFLDEPSTGLDPESRHNLWSYLLQVRKERNTTLFLTTHYLEEAEDADHICIINHGKIVALTSPQKLKEKFVHEYMVVDAANRSALRSELEKLPYKIEGSGPFMVHVQHANVQSFLGGLRTPLTTLKLHAPSVEEAYLEVIKNHDE